MSTEELRELQEWRRRFANVNGEPLTPAAARADFDRAAAAELILPQLLAALESVHSFLVSQEEFGLDVSAELKQLGAAIAAATGGELLAAPKLWAELSELAAAAQEFLAGAVSRHDCFVPTDRLNKSLMAAHALLKAVK